MARERKPRKRDIENYAHTDKERVNNPPVRPRHAVIRVGNGATPGGSRCATDSEPTAMRSCRSPRLMPSQPSTCPRSTRIRSTVF